jgi:hypothetical protein
LNAGSNGQALTKQSGNNGGLTWATVAPDYDTGIIFNESGNDVDFRFEGNGDGNLMIIDGGTDNVSFSRGSAATDQAIVHISRGGYNPGSNGKHALMIGANIGDANALTNSTRKFGSVVCPHYTNAEEPLTFMNIDSDNGSSVMTVGGYGTTNSVEKITFRTATDDADKATGADRMVIASDGAVGIGETSPLCDPAGLHIKTADTGGTKSLQWVYGVPPVSAVLI